MFRPILGAATFLLASTSAFPQTTPISIVNGTYFQDFNTMGTAATGVYPVGWNGYKASGTGAMTTGSFITGATTPPFTTSDGSGVGLTGTMYNFGTTGNADRAMGSIAVAATIPGFGVVLVNDTGRVLTSADVELTFRAEQWRTGNNAEVENWAFQWVTSAGTTDVNDGTLSFTNNTAFDLVEILTADNSNVGVDGNANFVNVGPATLSGLTWNPGERLILRWLDVNNTGSDAAMSIDNFSFTVFAPVPEPAMLLLCGFGLVGWALIRRRKKAD
jgi:hypothetical protein